jgi:hypothetical protein
MARARHLSFISAAANDFKTASLSSLRIFIHSEM